MADGEYLARKNTTAMKLPTVSLFVMGMQPTPVFENGLLFISRAWYCFALRLLENAFLDAFKQRYKAFKPQLS